MTARGVYAILIMFVMLDEGMQVRAQDIFDPAHAFPYLSHLVSEKKFTLAEEEIGRLQRAHPELADTLAFVQLKLHAEQESSALLRTDLSKLSMCGRPLPEYLAVYALRKGMEADSIGLVRRLLALSAISDTK